MSKFVYKAVPAPTKGQKAKGVKSTEERFALSITDTLNEMAADGWEYVRAETLPCDERKGLTGTQTSYQNILIFKRFLQAQPMTLGAETQPAPTPAEPPQREMPLRRAFTSEDRPSMDVAPPPPRPISEPVAPRRISSQPPETGTAPPLGSAKSDD